MLGVFAESKRSDRDLDDFRGLRVDDERPVGRSQIHQPKALISVTHGDSDQCDQAMIVIRPRTCSSVYVISPWPGRFGFRREMFSSSMSITAFFSDASTSRPEQLNTNCPIVSL